jgi:thioredoxin reductase
VYLIGHGACLAAWPGESIRLVFVTDQRGVDIPYAAADFQTNMPGVFIAGELGGTGLIRNAIEQGRRQAIDSVRALEAAANIVAEPGTTVTLSRRSEGFSRAKLKSRERVEAARKSGRLRVLLQTDIEKIGTHDVELAQNGERTAIRNDAVIVCAGSILPTPFLKSIGIEVETKYGTA